MINKQKTKETITTVGFFFLKSDNTERAPVKGTNRKKNK